MSEERDREHENAPGDPEAYSFRAEFWRDPGPADRCPDCRGRGRILLLFSTVPCQTCGGRGFLGEAKLVSWTAVTKFEDPEDSGRMSYDVNSPEQAP